MLKETLQKVFWGWWIVLTCALIASYGAGTFFYGFSVFVHPIVSEMGWSMALVSGAFSLYRLESGVAAPIVGFLLDTIGPKKVVMLGAVLLGIGYICLSQVETILPFYLSFLIISLGFGFSSGVLIGSSLISKWFIRKRGKALGLYFALMGLSGFLVPVLSHVVILYGWRSTVFFMGPVTWLVVLPLAALLRRKPEEYGLLPDGELSTYNQEPLDTSSTKAGVKEINFSVRKAMHTSSYWLLALCSSVFQTTMSAIFVHLVPYLITVGFEARLAALVVTCVIAASVLGGGVGWLSDLFSKKVLLMICFLMQFMGILILVYARRDGSSVYIISFILVYGFSHGSVAVLRPATVAEFYGRERFGTIWGLLQGMGMFCGIIGPVVVGLIYDIYKSYRLGLLFLSFINLLTFFLMVLLKRPGIRDEVAKHIGKSG